MKKKGLLGIFLFLLLCLSIFFNLFLIAIVTHKRAKVVAVEKSYDEEVLLPGSQTAKIVVIPLIGTIAFSETNPLGNSLVDDLKDALLQAELDPDVKAVVISVDSPGGEVTASDAIYHSLQTLSKKKPVICYINSIGASGAYYAACGASWIICSPTTFTGSIGVIISTLNYRELFGKIGLQAVVFKSGKFKDMLNPAREMTPEEKAYVQQMVMQTYNRFLHVIASSRRLDPETLRNGIADGRVLSGEDAYREKLVDGLGYIENAYAKAKELSGAKNACVVNYKAHFSFSKLFRLLSESAVPRIQIDLPQSIRVLEPGRLYLIPSILAP